MPDTTFKILIADPIHEDGQKLLAADPNIEVEVATGLDEAGLIAKVPGFDAMIVRSKSRVTKPILEAARSMKAVGRAGIGVDNIDIPAATEHGIVVFNTPDANATTTAELTVAHIMSLSRHLPRADRSVRNKEWQPARFMGTEVAGKVIGIIGFGTIGRLVAERCAGLKMKVLAFDPFVTKEIMQQFSSEPATLEDLLRQSDYVTLHCPMTEKTRNLIDRDRIAMMKHAARLINCARGGLVDEAALDEALASGQLAGAALDVYAKEPPVDSPLITRDNVVLTPHLGASTSEAQQAVSVKIAELIAKFLMTGEAETAVNLPRISPEQFTASRPHQVLAHSLGRLASALAPGPVSELIVRFFGRVSEFDPRPISTEAIVGFLERSLPERVNRVNAQHLAKAQGMELRVSQSEISRDYLSLVEVEAIGAGTKTTVAGTLLGGRLPRIVRIDGYHVEAVPEGHFLFTRHHDRPGVVGALGGILGREEINIERMTVGLDGASTSAIALVGISAPLSETALAEIRALPQIIEAVEFAL
jgi:D-3-phosphoglycerate dehydrogenase